MAQTILMIMLPIVAVFLILMVLVQRGRGGGLAGALGGLGGQSAFGTKAGDRFTRWTMAFAAGWILLCALAVVVFRQDEGFGDVGRNAPQTTTTDLGAAATTGDSKSSTPQGESGAAAPQKAPEGTGAAATQPDKKGS